MPKLGSPATLSRQARADKPHLRFATAADAKTEKPQREASVTIAAFSELNSATQERLSSIFQMVDHFRAMADNPDAAEMRLAAQDFNRCLEKVLRGCKDLPSTVRSGSEFQIAFRGAVFSGLGFGRHVRFVKADVYFVDAVQVSLEWLDMTVSSLKELFRVIKRLRDEHKPLPHVPSSSMPDNEPPLILEYPSSVLEEEVLLAVDPPTPIATPPEDISFVPESSYIGTEISALEATIEPVARATVVKGTLRRLVLGVARRNNLKPLTMWSNTTFSKSATTLVPSPCVAEFGGPKTPTTPSSIEHVPHGTEPASFGVKENTPPGSTVDLHFSAAGVLCAASHSGLVRVLTSMEAVTDPSLNNLFFFSFRFFSTPQAVFDALVARYNEQPPEGLAPGQSISWEDQARITRVRVAKVLLLWLRVYWRYEWDAEILEPLRQLVSSRLSTDPAAAILTKVAEQVDIASAGASYRGSRPRTRPETPPTSQHQLSFQPLCKDAMIKGAFHEVDILHFHSPEGREELVRQLCLAGSELFCAINPEDAVRYWKDNKNKQVRGIISRITVFENAIVYWVANSIVARPTVRSRAEVVEFFLDVALRCVEMRNFACASAMSSGIDLSMNRLRETTEALSETHKGIANDLETLFALRNRKTYRVTLASNSEPAVPLIATFKHDIDVCFGMKGIREHPDQPGTMLIDLERYRVISRTIQSMEACHSPYRFRRIGYMHQWLQHVLCGFTFAPPEEYLALLDDLSDRVEPRRRRSQSPKTSNETERPVLH